MTQYIFLATLLMTGIDSSQYSADDAVTDDANLINGLNDDNGMKDFDANGVDFVYSVTFSASAPDAFSLDYFHAGCDRAQGSHWCELKSRCVSTWEAC